MDSQIIANTSCVACAKRKVKCDRHIPCRRCTRRGESCDYPVGDGSVKGQTAQALVKSQQDRIVQLEEYIRQTSGNIPNEGSSATPPQTSGTIPVGRSTTSQDIVEGRDHRQPRSENFRKRSRSLSNHDDRSREGPGGGLVVHDDQTSYIEAPIWFSWDETKQREPKTSQAKVSRGLANDDADDNPAGYYHTLLQSTGRTKLFQALSTDTSRQLWQKYLSNVHPLTKIFLDWDKAPLMERAATDPDSLFPGQRAFVAAAHFIATLSLSEDDAPLILDRQQSSKGEILLDLQLSVESALMDAKYASTGELQVLQALVMYILAMRNRARPAECFSLMGIAVRIAQRLGIHRDGGELGLPPCKAEERRRTWWQMQYMEIMISQLLGCISVTLYCNWDAKIPANLDDHEIRPEMKDLPPDRQGLTSMSYVLWGYEVPHLQRQHFNPTHGAIWGSSSRLPSEKKQMMMDGLRKHFAERYVQYCELVNPLHVQIQIGLNSALLALQRAILQPTVGVSRLSEMPSTDREELLKVCVKAMDYFLLTRTNTTLAGFQWLNECWFQWTAFVYILVETERRATTSEAATLWTLIEQICLSHPKILTHTARPDISAIGRLILCAWQKRSDYLDGEQRQETKPSCVSIFEQAYATSTNSAEVDGHDLDLLPDTAFDFDLIDWSSWDAGNFWPEQLEDFQ